MFQTYKTLDKKQVVNGVDTYVDATENNNLRNLLKIPFQKARFTDEMHAEK